MIKRGLFIGRFQPFHKGHLKAIKYILERVEELILVIGSAQHSHEILNPFTAGERLVMIKLALNEIMVDPSRYIIIPVPDVTMHSGWFSELQAYVPSFEVVYSNEPLTCRLVKEAGYKVEHVPLFHRKIYRATEIRNRILSGGKWTELVPSSVANFIKSNNCFQRIVELNKNDIVNYD